MTEQPSEVGPMRAAFWEQVAAVLGGRVEDLPRGSRLADLEIDEVALFRIVIELQALNQWFEIPGQMDALDSTLEDLCHYFLIMGPNHATSKEV